MKPIFTFWKWFEITNFKFSFLSRQINTLENLLSFFIALSLETVKDHLKGTSAFVKLKWTFRNIFKFFSLKVISLPCAPLIMKTYTFSKVFFKWGSEKMLTILDTPLFFFLIEHVKTIHISVSWSTKYW